MKSTDENRQELADLIVDYRTEDSTEAIVVVLFEILQELKRINKGK